MPAFLAPILASAIPAIAGLFGGRKQNETQQTQNTSQNFNNNFSNTSTPNLNPFQQQLAQMFTQGAMDQYKSGTNLTPYTQQGMQQIAGQGAANNKMISNILAQRGLSFSPAAATGLTANALNTGGAMNNFMAGIPLLQRQMQQEDLNGLMKAFAVQPYGTTNNGTQSGTSTGNMTGSGTTFGNPTAGFFGGLGAGLFAPNGNSGNSNLGSIIDSIWGRPKDLKTLN